MKITWVLFWVLALAISNATAQPKLRTQLRPDAGKKAAYSISERGPHHKVWERIQYEPAMDGTLRPVPRRYEELATGMHFKNELGEWEESEAKIEILPNNAGAAASKGQHKAIFPVEIKSGIIELQTPEGQWLRSRVWGLAYFDSVSGESVLLAEVKESDGQVVGDNIVVYPDAFTDLRADIRLTYTLAGFEQDVVLRVAPPAPEKFNLNPKTTRLQVLTEFVEAPQPVKEGRPAGELPDEALGFGAMTIGAGKAFSVDASGEAAGHVPVSKTWTPIEGRDFLIEEVLYEKVAEQLRQLPEAKVYEGAGLERRGQGKTVLAGLKNHLPKRYAKGTPHQEGKPRRMARVEPERTPSFVMDYLIVTSQTNYTFKGDTTYSVSGTVNLSGTTVIEGGAVIKYHTNASTLNVLGTIDCQTAAYRPAYFTTFTDNTIGEVVPGTSTTCSAPLALAIYNNWSDDLTVYVYDDEWNALVDGEYIPASSSDSFGFMAGLQQHYLFYAYDANWNEFYWDFWPTLETGEIYVDGYENVYYWEGDSALCTPPALAPTIGLTLAAGGAVHDLHFRNLDVGISSAASYAVTNAQFLQCSNALLTTSASFYAGNILLSGVKTGFGGTSYTGTVEHLTYDQGTQISGGTGTSALNLVNSLLTGVTNNGVITPSFNYAYKFATNTGIYRSVGGGGYYLVTSSTNRDAGTPSINAGLLAQLGKKTTESPIAFTNVTFTTATNFYPQAQRDTNTLDLGYHYDPLDYSFGGCHANSNITFTAGTAVGWFRASSGWNHAGQGIHLGDRQTGLFDGSVTAPCYWVRLTTVQENDRTAGYGPGGITGWANNITNAPDIKARFTRFSMMSYDGNHCRDDNGWLNLRAQDCEFYGGGAGGYVISMYFTNCLFSRMYVAQVDGNGPCGVVLRNCTMIGSLLQFVPSSAHASTYKIWDCAFDGTSFQFSGPAANSSHAAYNYNSYTNATRPFPSGVSGPNDVVVSGGFNWQTGPLGHYYLPTNSTLINTGSLASAASIGLYHYTTQTNQTKEGTSKLDLGYHYVATDANGVPLDTDEDGTPDYVEDADGDGVVDAGETLWGLNITGQPQSQSISAGGSVTFTVTPAGITPFSYQWKFNGDNIAGATSSSYTINPVSLTNAGSFTVVVTNIQGAVTSTPAALTVTCVSPPSGLVGWWQAESNALDSISNHHGVFVSSGYTNGNIGKGFQFDGTNSHVVIQDESALALTNFTIETWVKFDGMDSPGTAGAGIQYLVFKKNTQATDFEGYWLGKSQATGSDAFVFRVSTSNNVTATVRSSTIQTGVWYHVVVMRGPDYIRLFTNGQFAAQATVSFDQNYGPEPLYFGSSGQPTYDRKFKGKLDEVSIYNRPLTTNEVVSLYLSGSLGKCAVLPRIIPSPRKALSGETANFSVAGGGTPPLGYQWRFAGTNIVGATNGILTLTNLQASHSGSYTIFVTNSSGTVSTNATLTVQPCFPALDVMMVIDRSLSMTNNIETGLTRFQGAKIASSNFVANLNTNYDQSGLVHFSDYPATNSLVLTNRLLSWQQAIQGIPNPAGNTYMSDALLKARAELNSSRRNSEALPVIVFLSDGQVTDLTGVYTPAVSNLVMSVADSIKKEGTVLFTVALSSQADTNFMRVMASSPASYYAATNLNQLTNVYSLIADSICRSPSSNVFGISIVSPTNNHNMLARETFTIQAHAYSVITNIEWVQIFAGPNSLGYAVSPNTNGYYEVPWAPITNGTHTLTARAMDARGSNVYSTPVAVNVRGRPLVIITNPVAESIHGPATLNISINANATAFGATITNVSYYTNTGTARLGFSTTGPSYPLTWNNVGSGTYSIIAKATDNTGLVAASDPVEITVVPVNQGPVVNAGADLKTRLPVTIPLSGIVTDDGLPLGNAVTITWTNLSAPAGAVVTFQNPNDAVTTMSANKAGYYTNRLQASDGDISTNDLMVVEVLGTNLPPVVNPGTNQTVTDGLLVQLRGMVTDDGVPATGSLVTYWQLVDGPGTAQFVDAARTNTAVLFSQEGTYQLVLRASDGELTTSSNLMVSVFNYGESNAIPYGADGYLYKIVTNGTVANFYETNFTTDASWTNGQAPFGSYSSVCTLNNSNIVRTLWPEHWPEGTANTESDLLVRRLFEVPTGTTNLAMGFTVDNDVKIYINGNLITRDEANPYAFLNEWNNWVTSSDIDGWYKHGGCPRYDDLRLANISNSVWHVGTNLLAVRGHNIDQNHDNPTFLDMRILCNSPFRFTNLAPVVIVGADQVVSSTNELVQINGFVADDSLSFSAHWTLVSGPESGVVTFYYETNSTPIPNGVDFSPINRFTNASVLVSFDKPGDYVLRLSSFYEVGSVNISDDLTVHVLSSEVAPPTVLLTNPTNNAPLTADAVASLTVSLANITGTITNVEYVAASSGGAFLIGRTTNTPFASSWLPGIPGEYVLYARAFEDTGRVGISAGVPVQVLPFTVGNRSPKAITDRPTVFAGSFNNIIYPLANDTDEDGDTLVITEISPASKARIVDGGKAIIYTPPSGRGYPIDGFSYRISDGHGGTSWGSVYVNAFATDAPEVLLVAPVTASQTHTTNAGAIVPITAYVQPSPYITKVEFSRNGFVLGTVTNGTSGLYTLNWIATHKDCECGITATAYDVFGQIGTSEPIYITANYLGNGVPQSSILIYTNNTGSHPFTNEVVIKEGFLGLYGLAYHTANSNVTWQLDLHTPDGEWVRTLTNSSAPLGSLTTSNFLVNGDLTTLENGTYDLKLTVTGGHVETNTTVRFILDSNLKIGQFGFSQQDLVIPVSGIPLAVVRTYNSLNQRKGDLGYSWTYAINDLDVVLDEIREQTPGWSDDDLELTDQNFSQRIGGGRNVTLTLPDGQRTTFYFSLEPGQPDGGVPCFCYEAKWTPPPGVTAKLEPTVNNTLYAIPWGIQPFWQAGGPGVPMDNYDFPAFVLTTADGTRYNITRENTGAYVTQNETGSYYTVQTYGKPKLSHIIQRSGDTISIGSDSIVHSTTNGETRRVVFQRNTKGLISGISDPAGLSGTTPVGPLAVKYEYDSRDNLFQVLQLVDRATETYVTNTFSYGLAKFPHYITAIQDPRGITLARNEYDDDGRLTAVVDANGKRTEFQHNSNGRVEIIVDRLGNTNSYAYDLRGNVTFTTNAMGIVTAMGYGDPNFTSTETAVTNALGTAQMTWTLYLPDEAGRQTNVVSSPNHTNSFRYDQYGNLLWQRDPVGNVTTNGYDGFGNLTNTVQLDANGTPIGGSSSVYEDSHLVETRNFNGVLTASFEYDPSGNLTNTTDANGVSRRFAYDANGNQTESSYSWTPPGGGTSKTVTNRTVYDAQGRVTMSVDPLGNTNRTFYNALGKVDYAVDKVGNTNSFLYDTRGNLIRTTDAQGLVTYTVYDDAGRAFFTMDRNGITGTRTYFDALGRATNVVRVTNAVVTIASGPISVLTSGGTPISTNSTEYLPGGWVKSRTGPDNKKTTYAYWPDGQTMYVTNALNQTTFYKYDDAGRQEYVADALNRTNRFEYDAAGRMFKTVFQNGTYTSNYFNNLGQRTVVRDQGGLLTQFGYDISGQLTNVIKPQVIDGITGSPATPEWTYKYDAYGRQTETIDPKVHSTTNSYDQFGREVSRWLPMGGASTTNHYNALGQLTNQVDFKGQRKQTRYDRFGRVGTNYYFATLTSTYPSNTVVYLYNQLGQLTNITERSGTDASTGYVAALGMPGGKTGRYAAMLAFVNRIPTGAQGGFLGVLLCGLAAMTFFTAEARRRRVRTWEFARTVLTTIRAYTFSLSAGGEGRGEVVRSPIQFRSLPSSIIHLPSSWIAALIALCSFAIYVLRCGGTPDGTPKRFRLPSYGWRLVTIITLAALIGSDPRFDALWTARAACTDPGNSNISPTIRITEFSYDVEGRLAQVNSPEGYINYNYDLATGRHLGTCTKNSETTYEYDALGRLWKVNAIKRNGSTINETTIYTYTAVGSRESVSLPNGVVTTWQYDELNRLTNMVNVKTSGNELLSQFSYKLDPSGRRTNAVEILKQESGSPAYQTNTLSWAYDGLYRLTNEVCVAMVPSASYTNRFQYDKTGNRWSNVRITSSGTTTVTNQYNANDQLLKEVTLSGATPITTNSYAYDANGSLLARTNVPTSGTGSTNLYSYDLKNKLSQVASYGGIWTTNSFLYNEQGIRVRTTPNSGSPTLYLVDGNNHTGYAQVLEELSALGVSASRSYVLGDDVLGQANGSSAGSYLLYDGHGSTRQLADNTGAVSSRYNYDAYGQTLTATSTSGTPATSLLYCGEQYDSTLNMYNLRARLYDPSNGRFNAMDTFRGYNEDPQSLHKYAYCQGDPVNRIDPTGNFDFIEVLLVAAIVGSIFAFIGGQIAYYKGGTTKDILLAQAKWFVAGFGITVVIYGSIWAISAGAAYVTQNPQAVTTITYTSTTALRQEDAARRVPQILLEYAIKYGAKTPDPQGVANAFRSTCDFTRNGKLYELEVVWIETSPGVFQVLHFLYK